MAAVDEETLAKMGMSTAAPGAGAGAGAGGGAPDESAEAKRAAQEEALHNALRSILEPAAKERLARIALVKPDKARAIEMRLLQMAQGGMFQAKVDEKKLISMLEQIDEASSAARTKITFKRRGGSDDEDDDDDDWA